MTITCLKANSFCYKFMEVDEILYDKLVDVYFFVETKLDDTFNRLSCNVPGYTALETTSIRQEAGSLLM